MGETWICLHDLGTKDLRSESTPVYQIYKSYKHKTQPPKWWYRFSPIETGYCWLTTLKRVQQSQTASTHLSWTKWSRQWSPNSRKSCQKECRFPRTMPPHTWLPSHSRSRQICILKCWHTLPIHLIWPLQTTICFQTLKIYEQDEIFSQWGFHVCCRRLVCSPTFSILSEWLTEAAAVV